MESFNELPDVIKHHLQSVTDTSGLPKGPESLEKITNNWLEKRQLFQDQLSALDMIEVERLDDFDTRAVLVLTYSGSLVALGPETGSGRWMEYASIKLRQDVPDLVQRDRVSTAAPIAKDAPVELKEAPVKASSPALIVATFDQSLPNSEQEIRIREATIFLTNGFVKLNKTLSVESENTLEQFNKTTIVTYIAKKNGLTQKQTRQVVDDYVQMLEAGMLLGERVGLGRIARLFLAKRPPQKARVGRNPATGEEMTIPAKPATAVPKASFSQHIKDRAGNLRMESIFGTEEESEGVSEE
jgi:nucleoid DNA-binding protein